MVTIKSQQSLGDKATIKLKTMDKKNMALYLWHMFKYFSRGNL